MVARSPEGEIASVKLLSENPGHHADAAVHGIGLFTAGHDAATITAVRMGTTVATNALLQRRGAPTALVTTRGFGNALRIGYQNRPDIFALRIELPEMLYSHVIEADERVSAGGEVITPLNEASLRSELVAAQARDVHSVAIVFLHGYRFPEHERRAAEIAGVRFSAGTMSAASRCVVSAVRRVNMRARWPTRWAWNRSSCTLWPVCCPPTAWAWPRCGHCSNEAWSNS